MLKHLSGRFSRKRGGKQGSTSEDGPAVVKVDMDELSEEDGQEFSAMASQMSGIEFYEGHVEHGYSMDAVSNAQECPRCRAPTERYYANFIYATQIAPRVMFAPAGYFCTKCPTVIVDEDLIQTGVKRGFHFQGILGLDYEDKKAPDLFRTWNGKDAIYILDEHQTAMRLSTLDSAGPRLSRPMKPKSKRRKRVAKRSRGTRRRRKKR